MVISGLIPSSINIGTTTGASALHLALADPINRSSIDDSNSTPTNRNGALKPISRSTKAPSIAKIGPRRDQLNIATKCAAKKTKTI